MERYEYQFIAVPAQGGLKVKPGDTLETECEITRQRGNFYFAKGKGSVNGKVCVSAEFSFALVKSE